MVLRFLQVTSDEVALRPVGPAIPPLARQDAVPPEAPPHLFPDFRATSGGEASSRAHFQSSRPRAAPH